MNRLGTLTLLSLNLIFGVFLATQALVVAGGNLLPVPVSVFALLFAFIVTGYQDLPERKWAWRERGLLLAVGVAILCGLVGLSTLLITFSGDSVTDHMPTVHHLARGWNPFFDPGVEQVTFSPHFYFGEDATYGASIGKLLHYTGALAYQFTGVIEAGKWLNLIWPVLLALALLFLGKLLRFSGRGQWLFAATGALAPGVVNQMFSFYVDSCLLALLLLLALAQLSWFATRDRRALAIALLALALLPHAKLTGLPLGLLLIMPVLIDCLRRKRYLPATLFSLCFGVLLLHPYGSNWRHFGNPVFPMPASADEARFMAASRDRTAETYQASPALALWKSLTSECRVRGHFNSKFIAQVHRREVTECGQPDARVAGFGPLFGLTFFLSIVVAGFLIFHAPWRRHPAFRTWIWLAAVSLITVGLAPVTYWMRYIPQIYVWVALVAMAAIFVTGTIRQLLFKTSVALFFGALLLNSLTVLYGTLWFNGEQVARSRKSLGVLRTLTEPVEIYFESERHGNRIVLQDYQVPFREITVPCGTDWLSFSFSKVCLPTKR